MSYLVEIEDHQSDFSLIIEEDGRAAYAYLRKEGRIVGDVWLYNVVDPPQEAEWTNPDGAPFLNPQEYCRAEDAPIVGGPEDLTVRWVRSEHDLVAADVIANGRLLARLEPGSKPGWARLASKDGPLANVLSDEP